MMYFITKSVFQIKLKNTESNLQTVFICVKIP